MLSLLNLQSQLRMQESSPTLTLQSPAKINLTLRVLEKMDNGYHAIRSRFQAIALCDTLTFSISEKDQFTCSNHHIPNDSRNLVIQARDLFRQKTGWNSPIAIHLEKHIPSEAGLGGGSGNAATTLWALNQLSGYGLSDLQLAEWGALLGSDIPFFFSNGSAICEGRGEKVSACEPMHENVFVIAKPAFGLSTQKVYQHHQLIKHNVDEKYFNDLENSAFTISPKLANVKSKLVGAGFETVLLSGSGTAFFCLGPGDFQKVTEVEWWKTKPIARVEGKWYT